MKHISLFFIISISLLGQSAIGFADIPKFSQVAPGIFRGAQPEESRDYDLLRSYGIRSILNLRKDSAVDPERDLAQRIGFNFKNVPLSGFFYPSEKNIRHALEFLTDQSLQPVFVHCKMGKDRTGLVVGLYRVHFEHWTADAAMDEMKSFGFNPWLLGLSAYFWNHTDQPYGDDEDHHDNDRQNGDEHNEAMINNLSLGY